MVFDQENDSNIREIYIFLHRKVDGWRVRKLSEDCACVSSRVRESVSEFMGEFVSELSSCVTSLVRELESS